MGCTGTRLQGRAGWGHDGVTTAARLSLAMVRAGLRHSPGQPARPTPRAAVTLSWQQPKGVWVQCRGTAGGLGATVGPAERHQTVPDTLPGRATPPQPPPVLTITLLRPTAVRAGGQAQATGENPTPDRRACLSVHAGPGAHGTPAALGTPYNQSHMCLDQCVFVDWNAHTRAHTHTDLATHVHPCASNPTCSHTCAEMSLVHP